VELRRIEMKREARFLEIQLCWLAIIALSSYALSRGSTLSRDKAHASRICACRGGQSTDRLSAGCAMPMMEDAFRNAAEMLPLLSERQPESFICLPPMPREHI
jgi:hypothetical protein